MKSKHPHKNLEAWKKSMNFVEDIYSITEFFPKNELYGLTSQMRRASISVPSNIAEGAVGRTNKDFARFLTFAIGSLAEIDTQIELAYRIGYVESVEFNNISKKLNDCKAVVFGLRRSVLDKK